MSSVAGNMDKELMDKPRERMIYAEPLAKSPTRVAWWVAAVTDCEAPNLDTKILLSRVWYMKNNSKSRTHGSPSTTICAQILTPESCLEHLLKMWKTQIEFPFLWQGF